MDSGGKLALVTGASSGIGAATAVALGREGWRVVLVARGRAALEEVARQVREAGGTPFVEAVDAADGEAVLQMAGRVRSAQGVPDVIVHCAGAGAFRFIEETPPAAAAAAIGAPFLAAFHVNHAFMADLLSRRSGLLVHVGSPASRLPFAGATAYIASRWALRGLHEALCEDLRGTGVRSSHVVFGKVASPYFEHNPGSEERIPGVTKLAPVQTPEACARVVLDVIRRPRRQVIVPFLYRLFYAMDAVAPRLVRWLGAATSPVRRGR
jgi:uncharacterized protein